MKYLKDNKLITTYAIMVIFSASFPMKLKSQPILEGGPFLGISWYNGDLNPDKQFYRIHPAYGAFLRYSVNDRLGFRGSFLIGGISGVYPMKDVLLQHENAVLLGDVPYNNILFSQEEENKKYHFKRSVSDVAIMFEINLFSFDHPYKKESHFTPYMAFGIGTIFYKRYGEYSRNLPFVLSLPFGAGVKWKLLNGVRVGAEWTMRKSFADDFDYVGNQNSVNPADPYGFDYWKATHNNDWVSFIGVYASFTIFNRREICRSGYQ